MPPTSSSVRRALVGGVAATMLTASCSSGTPTASESSTSGAATTSRGTSGGGSQAGTTTPAAPASRTPASPLPATPVTLLAGLDIAWSVVVLPDRSALVSERNTGRIHRVPEGGGTAEVVGQVPMRRSGGEGGLLGLALPPDFEADPVVYAYYSTDDDNRVAALPWDGRRAGDARVVFSGIPRGINHNGGRIAFGPDGFLYVGTGEAGDTSLSQNLGSLGGKILRITPEGDPAPGNPFGGSPIYSYGHRNVQGLAWDSRKRLWASEFGSNVWDELNLVTPGANYGWPKVEGRAGDPEFADPVAQWPTSDLSPSGIAVGPDGAVYIAALRGESVWRVPVAADGTAGTPTRHLEGTYGRIRDIRFVGDRAWVLTSNGGDDRLVSLPLSAVGVG